MNRIIQSLTAAVALSCLSASLIGEAKAEPAVAQIDRSHYQGKWLEIGRTPMRLTDGCVAGFTAYKPGNAPNQVLVQDGCREGSPQGKLKTIEGMGTLTDSKTTKAKLRVRYPLLITFNYWVLYKSPDRSWFISANPDMRNLWIYARSVPSKSKLAVMVKKAKELGYDTSKLEFPKF
ncbi:lipocalin family protein [Agrobacterium rosae]|uniref:lipocalin family protein n=1 Tax=Agrobacterium rosae TaxID=1972867 RepID=UPI002A15D6AA|nr:lipocalin family protein [Agrobacterium rosae]MDX8313944.1 lipocalin family protein [Agrobacterium rosae]